MELKQGRFDYEIEQIDKIERICNDIKDSLKSQEESFVVILENGDKLTIYSSKDNLENSIKIMKNKGFKVER
jgi:hypothetical protein